MSKETDIAGPKNADIFKFDDHDAHRARIYNDVASAVQSTFPIEHNGLRLELEDLDYKDPETFSKKKQKDAKLKGRYMARRLGGTMVLKDIETGEELSRKETTLMRVPFLTERGTFLHGGNDYYSISQMRLLPGVYARAKSNGEFESQVNVKPGSGRAFRVQLEPQTGVYRVGVGQARIPLYSILHDTGVSDAELESRWGKDLLAINKAKYNPKALDTAYERLASYKTKKDLTDPTRQDKADAVRAAFETALVAESAVKKNLPALLSQNASPKVAAFLQGTKLGAAVRNKSRVVDEFNDAYIPFGVEGLLTTSEKLVRINKGEDEPDDRDDLQFKRLYRTHKLLADRVRLDAGRLRNQLMYRAAKSKNLDHIPPFYFDPYMTGHLIGNPLSSPIEETNPVQLEEHSRRITMMGPGGIGSSDAITDEAQAVHPSIFGFISPSEGPESEKAGVDVRAVSGARAGTDGRIYQLFYDKRSGNKRWMSSDDLAGLSVKLPS